MKVAILALLVGLVLGWYAGKRSADQDWQKRTIKGVAVDCYDSKGNLVQDEFAKFGGVRFSCAPGQTAKIHQATK